jgi:Helix-turn-helix domain
MPFHSTGLGSLVGPLVVKPRVACQMLSCSHKRLYQLLSEGRLESFKNGRSRLITIASIQNLIARGLAESASSKPKRPT